MRLRAIVLLSGAIFGMSAHSQEGIYVGVGLSDFDYEESFEDAFVGRVADTTDSWKLFGGFEFNNYVALEISYRETSELTQSGVRVGEIEVGMPPTPQMVAVTSTLTTDFAMTALTAVGQWPREWGAFLGGVGFYSSDNDFRQSVSSELFEFVDEGSIRDDGMTAMIGIEWRFGRFGTRYGVRLEYEWWDIDAADASAIGIGFSYGF